MSKISSLINMIISSIIYPFKKSEFKNRNIWLIGGHAGDIYNDNSKFFYEYMLENHKEIDTYWVVNKESKVFEKILENCAVFKDNEIGNKGILKFINTVK